MITNFVIEPAHLAFIGLAPDVFHLSWDLLDASGRKLYLKRHSWLSDNVDSKYALSAEACFLVGDPALFVSKGMKTLKCYDYMVAIMVSASLSAENKQGWGDEGGGSPYSYY